MSNYKSRTSCGVCGNLNLNHVMNYGNIPLAGCFPKHNEIKDVENYPFNLLFCDVCGLLQSDSIIDADSLFLDYRYSSSVGLTKHFTEVAQLYKQRFNLVELSNIVEIGSNDGVLLKPLMDLGLKPIGFDPATNICELAENKGCKVVNTYFNLKNATAFLGNKDTDLVIANNCFAHVDDIHGIIKGVKYCLTQEGTFVIEVHYLKQLIDQLQFDNIYHEHLYYYSLNTLQYLFETVHGLYLNDFDFIPVHSGSVRVYVSRVNQKSLKLQDELKRERQYGLNDFKYYSNFETQSLRRVDDFTDWLMQEKNVNNNISIIGYGATGGTTIFANLADLTTNEISVVIDDSNERNGRFIANKNIPIVDSSYLDKQNPDYIVIFAWNFAKMIIDKLNVKYPNHKWKYVVPLPELKIVDNSDELTLGL